MTTTINASNSGSGGLIQTADASGVLALQTAGTTAVTVDTSQNVGIGTSSPSVKFQVDHSSDVAAINASGGGVTLKMSNSSANDVLFRMTNNSSNFYDIRNLTSGSAFTIGYNGNERMRIDSSGRVLINKTSTDGGYLNIQNGSTTTRAYSNATLRNSRPAGTNYSVVSWNGSFVADSWIGQTPGSDALCFGHDAGGTIAEDMRIDTSGNVGIGTTSPASATNTNSIAILPGSGQILHQHLLGTASGSVYSYFIYNGSAIASISQNGTTGVLYNLTSDYRLKNNQQPLTGAKDFIMALQPKKWQWWDGSGEGVGFVAHEFMEVAKYSGHGEKDAVDADNKPVYQSIQPSSSEVMANLVAFVQEQQALITSLTARIAALEGTQP